MSSLFISYSHQDLRTVEQLEQALVANGYMVWREQENLYGGQQWPKTIGEAIASCDFFLLAWSQHAASSHFVDSEWNTAWAYKKVILPCLLDDTPLPPSLRAIHGIFCQDFETGVTRVLQALQKPITADDIPVPIAASSERQKKKFFKHWSTLAVLIGVILVIIALSYKFSALPNEETPTTHFTGVVYDSVTKEVIVDAMVIVVGQRRDTVFTTSSGDFSFTKIHGQIGEGVRVYVSKEGYKSHNEYVTLPSPQTFYLVKK